MLEPTSLRLSIEGEVDSVVSRVVDELPTATGPARTICFAGRKGSLLRVEAKVRIGEIRASFGFEAKTTLPPCGESHE